MNFRYPAIAACLAIAAAVVAPMAVQSAGAAEAPPGSKNFTSPGGVPNYFSNEAAPFVGSPNPRPAPAQPAPVIAAPAVVAPAPVRAAPASAPVVTSRGAQPSQPLIKTVTTVTQSRDRQGRTVRTVTVKRYMVEAVAAKGRAPARTARVEPRSAKTKSAAVKARPVSTGSKRAGRG